MQVRRVVRLCGCKTPAARGHEDDTGEANDPQRALRVATRRSGAENASRMKYGANRSEALTRNAPHHALRVATRTPGEPGYYELQCERGNLACSRWVHPPLLVTGKGFAKCRKLLRRQEGGARGYPLSGYIKVVILRKDLQVQLPEKRSSATARIEIPSDGKHPDCSRNSSIFFPFRLMGAT